jgi:hypothetical protein
VLAVYVKEKVEVETRRKAKELISRGDPRGRRPSDLGPKLEEMIDGFAERARRVGRDRGRRAAPRGDRESDSTSRRGK